MRQQGFTKTGRVHRHPISHPRSHFHRLKTINFVNINHFIIVEDCQVHRLSGSLNQFLQERSGDGADIQEF